jgi:hypothetical protein
VAAGRWQRRAGRSSRWVVPQAEKIRIGDDIRLLTGRGDYHYQVKKTHIVDPDAVWGLRQPRRRPSRLINVLPIFVRRPTRLTDSSCRPNWWKTSGGSVLKGTVVR